MIYLDNAATTYPKPPQVTASVLSAMEKIGGSPGRGGHSKSVRAGELVYALRQELSEMFGCESERVAFTSNCTQALNTAILGVLRPGDHVVISSLEHNSVLRPIHRLRERGVRFSVARVEAQNDDLTVENFRRLINKSTRAIICTLTSNVFGTVLPMQRIGELCKSRGLIFIGDGAQAAGMMDIDMRKIHLDVLCLPGHKGLMGPMGTGAVLFREGMRIEPLIFGGTGSFSMDRDQPKIYPDALESGTLNFPGLAGLLSGVRFVKRQGGAEIMGRKEREDICLIREALCNMRNVTVYHQMQGDNFGSVLSFNVGEHHSEEIAMLLDKEGIAVRGGYHCSFLAHNSHGTRDRGTVRVSTGYFTAKKDIKNFIFSLNKIAMGKVL